MYHWVMGRPASLVPGRRAAEQGLGADVWPVHLDKVPPPDGGVVWVNTGGPRVQVATSTFGPSSLMGSFKLSEGMDASMPAASSSAW